METAWIKMRTGLRHCPKVIAMARSLSLRAERDASHFESCDVSRDASRNASRDAVTQATMTRVTVCGLLDVWAALNNTLGEDGKASFMRLQDIDDIAEIPGFGDAMKSVAWVVELEDGSLVFPNFSENNSPSRTRKGIAKTDAERAKAYREKKRAEKEALNSVTPSRHVTVDKNREEKNSNQSNQSARAHEVPSLESVKRYAAFAPVPITELCAVTFFDTQEAIGWIDKNGHSIANWQAALRRFASYWNENERAKPKPKESQRAREYPQEALELP